MSSFCVSKGETDSPKQAIFPSFEKNVIFDAMGYQRFPEYQIPLPLFKVTEPRKFHFILHQYRVKHRGGKRAVLTICFTCTDAK